MHPRIVNSKRQPDCRCLCGKLLARLVPGGVELKCRRCQRYLLVPLDETPRSLRHADTSAKMALGDQ